MIRIKNSILRTKWTLRLFWFPPIARCNYFFAFFFCISLPFGPFLSYYSLSWYASYIVQLYIHIYVKFCAIWFYLNDVWCLTVMIIQLQEKKNKKKSDDNSYTVANEALRKTVDQMTRTLIINEQMLLFHNSSFMQFLTFIIFFFGETVILLTVKHYCRKFLISKGIIPQFFWVWLVRAPIIADRFLFNFLFFVVYNCVDRLTGYAWR